MKFTIIIPTYNEQEYIERCLQSIVQQDYNRQEFEIIASDAQSIDDTVNIARKYADKIVSTKQRGIAHGRNLGAQHAQGDILLFVDADVTLQPDFLSHLEKAFTTPPRAGRELRQLLRRSYTPELSVPPPYPPQRGGQRGRHSTASELSVHDSRVVAVTGVAIPADGGLLQRFVYRATYALLRLFHFFGLPLFPGLCVAYRRTSFLEVGGFREDFGITEDLDLSRRISVYGACLYEKRARASVSTRRLRHHALSTVFFHVYHDIRYLFTGKSARYYPKSEEIKSAADLWRQNR